MSIPMGKVEGVRFGYLDLNLGRVEDGGGIQRDDPRYAEIMARVQAKNGMIATHCDGCGTPLVKTSRHKSRPKRYCSAACAQAHQGKTPISYSPNAKPKRTP